MESSVLMSRIVSSQQHWNKQSPTTQQEVNISPFNQYNQFRIQQLLTQLVRYHFCLQLQIFTCQFSVKYFLKREDYSLLPVPLITLASLNISLIIEHLSQLLSVIVYQCQAIHAHFRDIAQIFDQILQTVVLSPQR